MSERLSADQTRRISDYKTQILSKFVEHDTLLEALDPPNPNDPPRQNVVVVAKRQKSDREIIEELRQCNAELRGFIVELFKLLENKPVYNDDDQIIKQTDSGKLEEMVPISTGAETSTEDDGKIEDKSPGNNLFEFTPLELPVYTSNLWILYGLFVWTVNCIYRIDFIVNLQ